MKTQAGVIKFCYERSRIRTPSLQGQVVIELRIDNAGRVSMARVRKSTLRHAETEGCLVRQFRLMKVPAGDGGAIVRYPLYFQSSGM